MMKGILVSLGVCFPTVVSVVCTAQLTHDFSCMCPHETEIKSFYKDFLWYLIAFLHVMGTEMVSTVVFISGI